MRQQRGGIRRSAGVVDREAHAGDRHRSAVGQLQPDVEHLTRDDGQRRGRDRGEFDAERAVDRIFELRLLQKELSIHLRVG